MSCGKKSSQVCKVQTKLSTIEKTLVWYLVFESGCFKCVLMDSIVRIGKPLFVLSVGMLTVNMSGTETVEVCPTTMTSFPETSDAANNCSRITNRWGRRCDFGLIFCSALLKAFGEKVKFDLVFSVLVRRFDELFFFVFHLSWLSQTNSLCRSAFGHENVRFLRFHAERKILRRAWTSFKRLSIEPFWLKTKSISLFKLRNLTQLNLAKIYKILIDQNRTPDY